MLAEVFLLKGTAAHPPLPPDQISAQPLGPLLVEAKAPREPGCNLFLLGCSLSVSHGSKCKALIKPERRQRGRSRPEEPPAPEEGGRPTPRSPTSSRRLLLMKNNKIQLPQTLSYLF